MTKKRQHTLSPFIEKKINDKLISENKYTNNKYIDGAIFSKEISNILSLVINGELLFKDSTNYFNKPTTK